MLGDPIKTNYDLANAAIECAKNYKTLYVNGGFGSPLNQENKERYSNNLPFNRKPERVEKIMAASYDTFAFDCICFIKGLLWGWKGDYNHPYGGAVYQSNGVPDITESSMLKVCSDVSNDFSNIEPGEYLWIEGHAGIYIGNGLTVECTHRWSDGVQFTACNRDVPGYNRRDWTYHGKLPYITYEYSQEQFIKEVQTILGHEPTGIADIDLVNATPTISAYYNNTHELVKPIQKWLYAMGYTQVGKADGEAGAKFTAAVSAYQKDNGLKDDGEVSGHEKTWKKLLDYTEPPKEEEPITPPKEEEPITSPKEEEPITPPKEEESITPPKEEEPVAPPPVKEPEIIPPAAEKPKISFSVGDCVKIIQGAKFVNGKQILSWMIDNKAYIRELRENEAAIISTQKVGPIAGAIYLKDVVLYTDDVYDIAVNANLLNVRADANATARIVNQIKRDTKHTIIEEKNGWGHIANSGWVNLQYAKKV